MWGQARRNWTGRLQKLKKMTLRTDILLSTFQSKSSWKMLPPLMNKQLQKQRAAMVVVCNLCSFSLAGLGFEEQTTENTETDEGRIHSASELGCKCPEISGLL